MANLVSALSAYLNAQNALSDKKEARRQKYLDQMGMMPADMFPTAGKGIPVGEGEVFDTPKTASRIPSVTSGGKQYFQYSSPQQEQELATGKAQQGALESESLFKKVSARDKLTAGKGGGGNAWDNYGSGTSGMSPAKYSQWILDKTGQIKDFFDKAFLKPGNRELSVKASMAFEYAANDMAIELAKKNFGSGLNQNDLAADMARNQVIKMIDGKILDEGTSRVAWNSIASDDGSDTLTTMAKLAAIDYKNKTGSSIKVSEMRDTMSEFADAFSIKNKPDQDKAFASIYSKNPLEDEPPPGDVLEEGGGIGGLFESDPKSKAASVEYLQNLLPKLSGIPDAFFTGGANIMASLPEGLTGLTKEERDAWINSPEKADTFEILNTLRDFIAKPFTDTGEIIGNEVYGRQSDIRDKLKYGLQDIGSKGGEAVGGAVYGGAEALSNAGDFAEDVAYGGGKFAGNLTQILSELLSGGSPDPAVTGLGGSYNLTLQDIISLLHGTSPEPMATAFGGGLDLNKKTFPPEMAGQQLSIEDLNKLIVLMNQGKIPPEVYGSILGTQEAPTGR